MYDRAVICPTINFQLIYLPVHQVECKINRAKWPSKSTTSNIDTITYYIIRVFGYQLSLCSMPCDCTLIETKDAIN